MTRRFVFVLAVFCLLSFSALSASAVEDVEVEIYGTSTIYSNEGVAERAPFFKIRVGTPFFGPITPKKVYLTECVGKYFAYGRMWIQVDENTWHLVEHHVEVDKITFSQACRSVKSEISVKTNNDLPLLLRALDPTLLKEVHYFLELYSGAFFIYLFDERTPDIVNVLAEALRTSSVQ